MPGRSSYNREDIEEAEALNNIVEDDMEEGFKFKVTQRASGLLKSPE